MGSVEINEQVSCTSACIEQTDIALSSRAEIAIQLGFEVKQSCM